MSVMVLKKVARVIKNKKKRSTKVRKPLPTTIGTFSGTSHSVKLGSYMHTQAQVWSEI